MDGSLHFLGLQQPVEDSISEDGKDYLRQFGVSQNAPEHPGHGNPGKYYEDVPLEYNPEAYLDVLCRSSLRHKKGSTGAWSVTDPQDYLFTTKGSSGHVGPDIDAIPAEVHDRSSHKTTSHNSPFGPHVEGGGRLAHIPPVSKTASTISGSFGLIPTTKKYATANTLGEGSKATKTRRVMHFLPQRKHKNKKNKSPEKEVSYAQYKDDDLDEVFTTEIITDSAGTEKSYNNREHNKSTNQRIEINPAFVTYKNHVKIEDTSQCELDTMARQKKEQRALHKNLKNITKYHDLEFAPYLTEKSITSPLPDVLLSSSPEVEDNHNQNLAGFLPVSSKMDASSGSSTSTLRSPTSDEKVGITTENLYENMEPCLVRSYTSRSWTSGVPQQPPQRLFQKQHRASQGHITSRPDVREYLTTQVSDTTSARVLDISEITDLSPSYKVLAAAKTGDLETVEDIIRKNNEVRVAEIVDRQRNNVLHLACAEGHVHLMESLWEKHPQLLLRENKDKLTPAAVAIKNGQIDCLDWLLEHADLSGEISFKYCKRTLLHQSAKFGQDGCLRLLLSKTEPRSASLECRDQNGNTPAHLAAKYGHLTCLQTLVEFGVDVCRQNTYGHTPCYLADFSNHRDCASYLMVLDICKDMASGLVDRSRASQRFQDENEILKACLRESLATNATVVKLNQNGLDAYHQLLNLVEEYCELSEALADDVYTMETDNTALKQRLNFHGTKDSVIREKQCQQRLDHVDKLRQRLEVETGSDVTDHQTIQMQLNKIKAIERKLSSLSHVDRQEENGSKQEYAREAISLMRQRVTDASQKLLGYRASLRQPRTRYDIKSSELQRSYSSEHSSERSIPLSWSGSESRKSSSTRYEKRVKDSPPQPPQTPATDTIDDTKSDASAIHLSATNQMLNEFHSLMEKTLSDLDQSDRKLKIVVKRHPSVEQGHSEEHIIQPVIKADAHNLDISIEPGSQFEKGDSEMKTNIINFPLSPTGLKRTYVFENLTGDSPVSYQHRTLNDIQDTSRNLDLGLSSDAPETNETAQDQTFVPMVKIDDRCIGTMCAINTDTEIDSHSEPYDTTGEDEIHSATTTVKDVDIAVPDYEEATARYERVHQHVLSTSKAVEKSPNVVEIVSFADKEGYRDNILDTVVNEAGTNSKSSTSSLPNTPSNGVDNGHTNTHQMARKIDLSDSEFHETYSCREQELEQGESSGLNLSDLDTLTHLEEDHYIDDLEADALGLVPFWSRRLSTIDEVSIISGSTRDGTEMTPTKQPGGASEPNREPVVPGAGEKGQMTLAELCGIPRQHSDSDLDETLEGDTEDEHIPWNLKEDINPHEINVTSLLWYATSEDDDAEYQGGGQSLGHGRGQGPGEDNLLSENGAHLVFTENTHFTLL